MPATARRKTEQAAEQAEAAHDKAECALREHPALGRWLRQTPCGRLTLDRAKITAEAKLDGKYLLSASVDQAAAPSVTNHQVSSRARRVSAPTGSCRSSDNYPSDMSGG